MMKRNCTVFIIALVLGGMLATAQYAAAQDRKVDEVAIRKSSEAFVLAFIKGDAQAIAKMWTENGEYISNDGEALRGRKAIAKSFAEFFKTKKERNLKLKVDSIRFLSKNTAIEQGILTTQHGKLKKSVHTRYSVLHVREDGNWLVAVCREWEEVFPESKLTGVSWLIGEWAAKTKDTEANFKYIWGPSKQFIKGQFSLKEGKKVVTSGFMVIGRDTAQDVLRSWVFLNDGSYGHGAWFREEKRWVIDSASKLADGREATATNIIVPISGNAYSFQSIERTAGGEALPDTAPVRIERVK